MYILGDVKDFFRFSRKPTTTDTPQIQPLVANMHGCNVSVAPLCATTGCDATDSTG